MKKKLLVLWQRNRGTKVHRMENLKHVLVFVLSLALVPNVFGLGAQPGGEGSQPAPMGSLFMPILFMMVFFYILVLRPQQKERKKHEALLNALKKGDRVLSTGGIYGTVSNVKGTVVEVKIAENVKVDMTKSSISQVVTQELSTNGSSPSSEGKK